MILCSVLLLHYFFSATYILQKVHRTNPRTIHEYGNKLSILKLTLFDIVKLIQRKKALFQKVGFEWTFIYIFMLYETTAS